MSKKWHSGPPPSVGWWPASIVQDSTILRWWDGKRWSCGVSVRADKKDAARLAMLNGPINDPIQWQDRPANWPARSRT